LRVRGWKPSIACRLAGARDWIESNDPNESRKGSTKVGYSAIEWTDETDNIIVVAKEAGGGWWCRKVSPACAHCYAEDWNRFRGNKRPYTGDAPLLVLKSRLIASWARQKKPRRHFVSSMTDVAGPWVPAAWVYEYLDGMAASLRQTFQILTKHPDVLLRHVTEWLRLRGRTELPLNIHVGVTIENQARADELIPILLRIPCAVRFLSIEPLLGWVDLSAWMPVWWCSACVRGVDLGEAAFTLAPDSPPFCPECYRGLYAAKRLISWVIVGGESGKRARPTSLLWLLWIVRRCRAGGVPVFVKQLGKILRTPYYDVDKFRDGGDLRERALDRPHRVIESTGHVWPGDYQPDLGSVIEFRLRHHKGADMTEWPAVLRVRELPEVAA